MSELPKSVLKLMVEPGDIVRFKKTQTTEVKRLKVLRCYQTTGKEHCIVKGDVEIDVESDKLAIVKKHFEN